MAGRGAARVVIAVIAFGAGRRLPGRRARGAAGTRRRGSGRGGGVPADARGRNCGPRNCGARHAAGRLPPVGGGAWPIWIRRGQASRAVAATDGGQRRTCAATAANGGSGRPRWARRANLQEQRMLCSPQNIAVRAPPCACMTSYAPPWSRLCPVFSPPASLAASVKAFPLLNLPSLHRHPHFSPTTAHRFSSSLLYIA